MNWRGRPLTSHEVVVELMGATTTTKGLTVHAERDTVTYPKGVTVSDEEMASLPLKVHDFQGEWNYTLGGRRPPRLRTTHVQLRQHYFPRVLRYREQGVVPPAAPAELPQLTAASASAETSGRGAPFDPPARPVSTACARASSAGVSPNQLPSQ